MKHKFATLLLPSRLLSFAAFQGIIALIFWVANFNNPWQMAQGYWIITGLITNIITFFILKRLFSKEGVGYFDNLKPNKQTWVKDLLLVVALMVIGGPLASIPNTEIAKALWGTVEVSGELFFRPLPIWVIWLGFIWALSQGVVELQMYFGYIMPRLDKGPKVTWKAWIISSTFLAFQHLSFPLIFDWKFMVWRVGMFLLFALFAGLCIKIRPRLLPFMAIIHALMDIALIYMLFNLKY